MNNKRLLSLLSNQMLRDILNNLTELNHTNKIIRAGRIEEKVNKETNLKIDYLISTQYLDDIDIRKLNR